MSVGAYALRPPFGLAIGTVVPLLVGAGWVAAPWVSSLKVAQGIRRPGGSAVHLLAAALAFAAGAWVYVTRLAPVPEGPAPESVLVYMLVPLLQAITLTVAGAAATAGERRPRGSLPVGRARDESDQKGG